MCISAVMNSHCGYACIILYNTAPLVVVADRAGATGKKRGERGSGIPGDIMRGSPGIPGEKYKVPPG